MGHITNKFTCVEFTIYPDYNLRYDISGQLVDKQLDTLRDAIEECQFKEYFNFVLGSNGSMFFTAAPSGSKVGWQTSSEHAIEVDKIISLIKSVASYCTVETVVTSDG